MFGKYVQSGPVAIGVSDFKKLREHARCYVDKSMFIQDVIHSPAEVLLLPRPRRFGKTLNLSMLRYFFEQSDDDRRSLFENLIIRQEEVFEKHHGKYPVIYLTFKDVKERAWPDAYRRLCRLIAEEIERHWAMLDDPAMPARERALLEAIRQDTASQDEYADSLRILSKQLARYDDGRVVMLIDEYDAPILAGHANGYFREIVSFMRNFLSGGLKDNPVLFKGVLTGILRVAKESIFSGLNNLGVYTLLRPEFNADFGFTQAEVAELLAEYGLTDRQAEVSAWYNGYLFGGQVIYNPWSILNYIASEDHAPRPYWLNTGDPAMLEALVTRGARELREELGALIEGGVITKALDDNIVMQDIAARDDLLWSLLLFSGYLKPVAQVSDESWQLQIPNREVQINYRQWVRHWFSGKVASNRLEEMLRGLETGDVVLFERILRQIVTQMMSYHDLSGEPEKVYHALVLGMLVWLSDKYDIRSNRESGYGRYDLLLKPKDPQQRGIIIEFKRVEEGERPERVLEAALEQIERKQYAAELEAAGIQTILKLAIAFQGKEVWVTHAQTTA